MKLKFLVKVTIIGVILFCEWEFAIWLQSILNDCIPHGEYYKLIHLIAVLVHIFTLGALYIWVAFASATAVLFLLFKDR
jgi:hypothetical protein